MTYGRWQKSYVMDYHLPYMLLKVILAPPPRPTKNQAPTYLLRLQTVWGKSGNWWKSWKIIWSSHNSAWWFFGIFRTIKSHTSEHCILYCTLYCKSNYTKTSKLLVYYFRIIILPASSTMYCTINCTLYYKLVCTLYYIIYCMVYFILYCTL